MDTRHRETIVEINDQSHLFLVLTVDNVTRELGNYWNMYTSIRVNEACSKVK